MNSFLKPHWSLKAFTPFNNPNEGKNKRSRVLNRRSNPLIYKKDLCPYCLKKLRKRKKDWICPSCGLRVVEDR